MAGTMFGVVNDDGTRADGPPPWTVERIGTGKYKITFNGGGFSPGETPAVVATSRNDANNVVSVHAATYQSCEVQVFDSQAGQFQDRGFFFIAMCE